MASMFTKLNFVTKLAPDQKKAEEIKQVGIIIIRQLACKRWNTEWVCQPDMRYPVSIPEIQNYTEPF